MASPVCVECGEEIREDDSVGVWLHETAEEDADHVAVPDNDDYGIKGGTP